MLVIARRSAHTIACPRWMLHAQNHAEEVCAKLHLPPPPRTLSSLGKGQVGLRGCKDTGRLREGSAGWARPEVSARQ